MIKYVLITQIEILNENKDNYWSQLSFGVTFGTNCKQVS